MILDAVVYYIYRIISTALIKDFSKRKRNIAGSYLRGPIATCFVNRPGVLRRGQLHTSMGRLPKLRDVFNTQSEFCTSVHRFERLSSVNRTLPINTCFSSHTSQSHNHTFRSSSTLFNHSIISIVLNAEPTQSSLLL